MNLLKLPLVYLLVIAVVAVPVAGQQKRRTPEKTPAKAPAAPAPTPEPATPVTFDTLLAVDTYKIYGEARGVGQLVRSSAANDILEPLFKLSDPGSEFTDVVNWLRTHADQLMTSRLMIAAWPNVSEVPEVMFAIEFTSVEEATKFESQVNRVLAKLLPPVKAPSEPEGDKKAKDQQPANEQAPPATVPGYYLQRADSLVLISPKPLQLKKLRPKGSKLLSEDTNFRTAYNRFNSEPIFVFVDINAMGKENEERRKKSEEEWKKQREAQEAAEAKRQAEAAEKGEAEEKPEETEAVTTVTTLSETVQPSPESSDETTPKEPTDAEVLSTAFSGLRNLLFGVQPHLPTAVGFGFTPDNESFDLRALMIDAAGEMSDPIPIFSALKIGDPVTPESPGVLPADSELVVMLSIDFPFIQELTAAFENPASRVPLESTTPMGTFSPVMSQPPELAAPLKTIERILKINVKDDLLPLLGSEVAVSMPVTEFGLFGPPVSGPRQIQPKDESKPPRTPFVVLSLRDREGMRKLMPRILEGFAGKAAAALAQTERREDTEIVSIANMFAYAFVGNFLVLGVDAATTRHVVDSYLKGETLGSSTHFKTYTRWQPRQLQGQLYVSPAFADSYRTWATSPNAHISDEARAFLTRVTTNPQPITYALSNDGLGWLHEAHIPKSLIVTAVAGGASTANPPQAVKNERAAMSMLWSISAAQYRYKEEKKGGYGSLEELISADMLSEDSMDNSGYRFEIRLTAEGYEIVATPVEYGKTGKLSFYMNSQSQTIRGGDHGGGPASASDLPIGY
ncbi:MAG TPA: hypothetical protein VFY34_10175 [Pyrinomonadaceae bacterium]|nr:hypothetical protein [Pyrinomonadaceae bacterium]